MSEELKQAMEELAGGVATLTQAVQEAKDEFKGGVPGDVQDKLVKMSEDIAGLSDVVRRIDSAPALKRAFDVDGSIDTKRMQFKKGVALPSSVTGDEDMKDLFECQDTLEVLRFVKRFDSSFNIRETKTWQRMEEILQRKLNTGYDGLTTQGLEWIPTGYSPDLIMKFELERQVASLFTVVNMPNDPFKIPQQTSRATAYLKSRMVNATESRSNTNNVTLSCQTIAAYSQVAYEQEEDSIIAMLPFIRQDLAQALADGEEQALVNGDTSTTHFDTGDTVAAADIRRAWKGLRKLAVAGSDTYDMGTVSTDALRALRAVLGKYGVSPRRLAYIVSPIGLLHMLGLAEVITLERYGPQATVITGELGRFDGTPVVPSGLIREDMNATGIYDGSTKTKTGILLVNTTGFVIGRRRSPMIESFRDIVAGADEIVASMREDFQPRYPSTEPLAAYAYDIPNTVTVGS